MKDKLSVVSLPKSRVTREQSPNGEVHFIFLESTLGETEETEEGFDETEMRAIMKKEASKPLLLLRAE